VKSLDASSAGNGCASAVLQSAPVQARMLLALVGSYITLMGNA